MFTKQRPIYIHVFTQFVFLEGCQVWDLRTGNHSATILASSLVKYESEYTSPLPKCAEICRNGRLSFSKQKSPCNTHAHNVLNEILQNKIVCETTPPFVRESWTCCVAKFFVRHVDVAKFVQEYSLGQTTAKLNTLSKDSAAMFSSQAADERRKNIICF